MSQRVGFWLRWLLLSWSLGSGPGGFSSLSSCGAGALVALQLNLGSGIFPDHFNLPRLNPHLLYWHIDSLLLSPQGSPPHKFLYVVFSCSLVSRYF